MVRIPVSNDMSIGVKRIRPPTSPHPARTVATGLRLDSNETVMQNHSNWKPLMRHLAFILALLALPAITSRAQVKNRKYQQEDSFRQLEQVLPTPNSQRTASGAPGSKYWQQRADYDIHVELDDRRQRIIGRETITYWNRSPDTLRYLWLQLDSNLFRPDSDAALTQTAPPFNKVPFSGLRRLLARSKFNGGVNITRVRLKVNNRPLKFRVVKTMMRVELVTPLRPGKQVSFQIGWNYRINDSKLIRGRTGFEYFEKDKNYIYEIAQWFPRMCAYTDNTGWQHKQFLGRGEFTLELGNYLVRITVPDDHIVGSTGVLINPKEVLTAEQRSRFAKARVAKKPMFIVTPEEAKKNESNKPKGKKTWIFRARNVRDFAFASSRKFIWDAQGHNVAGNRVMAMSYYPKEGEPLWSKYSTHAIIHTLNVYSKFTFNYPYPVAISVNGPVYGMEYPMICFNGPRPEADGTYSKRTKYSLISVIIHEVGHNYFPMIVNSDERQWTWMDEGLNTFLQYLAEQEWEKDYPSWRGEAKNIVPYMKSTNQVPIMTNSESILQFGANAYAKPATALNILRETVLGRDLFDYAFKEYSRRWKFKRPQPADFFRTMEDASGIDLDWFWRGWFYSTDHTDLAITGVRLYLVDDADPEKASKRKKDTKAKQPKTLSQQRNLPLRKRITDHPELKDSYNEPKIEKVTEAQKKAYQRFLKGLKPRERRLLKNQQYFYVVDLQNVGGLVMPVILQLNYEDGKSRIVRIPAEIWRRNNRTVSKLVISDKPIKSFSLDPLLETADTNLNNNSFPPTIKPSRFKLFKQKKQRNEMQRKRDVAKKKAAAAAKKKAAGKKKKKPPVKKKPAAKKKKPAVKKKPAAKKKSDAKQKKKKK